TFQEPTGVECIRHVYHDPGERRSHRCRTPDLQAAHWARALPRSDPFFRTGANRSGRAEWIRQDDARPSAIGGTAAECGDDPSNGIDRRSTAELSSWPREAAREHTWNRGEA